MGLRFRVLLLSNISITSITLSINQLATALLLITLLMFCPPTQSTGQTFERESLLVYQLRLHMKGK
jgi:hypothetical protein